VLAGNAVYQCGCMQYHTADNNLLIIALSVGIGLALIITIVVVVAWCICRKKPSDSDSGNSLDKTEPQDRGVSGFEDEQWEQEEYMNLQEDPRYSRHLPVVSYYRN